MGNQSRFGKTIYNDLYSIMEKEQLINEKHLETIILPLTETAKCYCI